MRAGGGLGDGGGEGEVGAPGREHQAARGCAPRPGRRGVGAEEEEEREGGADKGQ